ncbi:ATP-binding protein [Domibacillus sp. A3M-37]|uniref:ATP-binding protein n=1 Tax=Domibacillus sp. A3M-37 TaxID=2962037 RepID=UPI0020B87607|nr:ATP-binding protein [Domibacillus sp. A3M-37]MCP3761362.1 ATP-binding protein [Domibacillus sp. A3M-37]
MPSGGTLYVRTKLRSGNIQIDIIDQGIGISEERLPKLGEPFYSNKEKGIGLGLMLTYKIIEQHNWHIHMQSQVNHGTKITISVPLN